MLGILLSLVVLLAFPFLFPFETLFLMRKLKKRLRAFFAKHCSPEFWKKEKHNWDKSTWDKPGLPF